MEYFYKTSSGQMTLCLITQIDNSLADKITIYAQEHPKNPGFSITNSVEFLISEFEKLYDKKAIINYIDSEGIETRAQMVGNSPKFEMNF